MAHPASTTHVPFPKQRCVSHMPFPVPQDDFAAHIHSKPFIANDLGMAWVSSERCSWFEGMLARKGGMAVQ